MKRKGSNLEREFQASGSHRSGEWEEEDPFGRMYGDDDEEDETDEFEKEEEDDEYEDDEEEEDLDDYEEEGDGDEEEN